MMTQHDLVLQENRVIPEGYKQTEFGVIPESWEINTLEHFTDEKRPICYGIVQTGPKINSGVPCLRVVDILDKKINTENLIYTTQEISSSYKRTILKKGDLVFPLRGKIGTVGLINEELVGANLTRGVALIALKKSNPIFLKQLFGSHKILTQLHGSMNGSALQEITIDTLKKFKVVMPDIVEQQKIATALSDTDALISKLEKLIEKKQAIKTATMQQLLTGKTRLPEFALREDGTPKAYKESELGQIPEDWELSEIYELADRHKANFDDGDWIEAEHITNKGVRLIQTGNIGIGSFLDKESKKYIYEESFTTLKCKELRINDILICRLAEPAGRACIFEGLDDEKVITSVDVTIFRPIENNINRVFLNQFFTSDVWFSQVKEHVGGTTHKRISRGALGKLKVVMPTLDEQTKIAKILQAMDLDLAELKKNYIKYMHIKQGMMQELLTGKTRLV